MEDTFHETEAYSLEDFKRMIISDGTAIRFVDTNKLILLKNFNEVLRDVASMLYVIGTNTPNFINAITNFEEINNAMCDYEELCKISLSKDVNNLQYIPKRLQTKEIINFYVESLNEKIPNISFISKDLYNFFLEFEKEEHISNPALSEDQLPRECAISKVTLEDIPFYQCEKIKDHVYEKEAFLQWVNVSGKNNCVLCTDNLINLLKVYKVQNKNL